jgi:hypothetical protein
MKDEMDWTRSSHGRDDKCMQNLFENLKGRDHLGDLGLHERIILKWMLRK